MKRYASPRQRVFNALLAISVIVIVAAPDDPTTQTWAKCIAGACALAVWIFA